MEILGQHTAKDEKADVKADYVPLAWSYKPHKLRQ